MVKTDWLRLLGYVTGLVNQELLLKNEYLVAENRILKAHIRRRLLLSDGEKATLAEIAKRLGRQALAQIAGVAKPDTILAWFGKLIAKKFDGSKQRGARGRPHGAAVTQPLVEDVAAQDEHRAIDRDVVARMNVAAAAQVVGELLIAVLGVEISELSIDVEFQEKWHRRVGRSFPDDHAISITLVAGLWCRSGCRLSGCPA